jgi:hypothetical protein
MSSAPLNYGKIEEAMRAAIARMESLTQHFSVLADELGVAEADYKVAFAKARLGARLGEGHELKKITVDTAEDIATVETDKERRVYEGAKAKHDACRQALMTVRAQMEGFRSLMASHRDMGN